MRNESSVSYLLVQVDTLVILLGVLKEELISATLLNAIFIHVVELFSPWWGLIFLKSKFNEFLSSFQV